MSLGPVPNLVTSAKDVIASQKIERRFFASREQGLHNSTDLDRSENPIAFEDASHRRSQRIADALSRLNLDEIRRLVAEIETQLKRRDES
jgi:hypothetical protein